MTLQLNEFEKWVADRAISYLAYDDANPDVGMGMFNCTAIDYAMNDLKHTATLFAGGYDFALLQVNIQNVEDFVKRNRRR